MLQLFRDIYRQEVNPGGYKTVLQFWAFILKDVVRSLFREHLTQGAKPMSIVSSRSRAKFCTRLRVFRV